MSVIRTNTKELCSFLHAMCNTNELIFDVLDMLSISYGWAEINYLDEDSIYKRRRGTQKTEDLVESCEKYYLLKEFVCGMMKYGLIEGQLDEIINELLSFQNGGFSYNHLLVFNIIAGQGVLTFEHQKAFFDKLNIYYMNRCIGRYSKIQDLVTNTVVKIVICNPTTKFIVGKAINYIKPYEALYSLKKYIVKMIKEDDYETKTNVEMEKYTIKMPIDLLMAKITVKFEGDDEDITVVNCVSDVIKYICNSKAPFAFSRFFKSVNRLMNKLDNTDKDNEDVICNEREFITDCCQYLLLNQSAVIGDKSCLQMLEGIIEEECIMNHCRDAIIYCAASRELPVDLQMYIAQEHSYAIDNLLDNPNTAEEVKAYIYKNYSEYKMSKFKMIMKCVKQYKEMKRALKD